MNQSMTEAFQKELRKFDIERALPAWDGLISKQQTELESMGVPSMYLTTLTADREVRAGNLRLVSLQC